MNSRRENAPFPYKYGGWYTKKTIKYKDMN
jgi:hypothetical protein